MTARRAGEEGSGKQLSRRPLPDGVVEIAKGLAAQFASVVELKDGSLLANNGQLSSDGGKSWSELRSFGEGIEGAGLLRLKSGRLALTGSTIHFSEDEGKTWGQSSEVIPKLVAKDGHTLFQGHSLADTIIQLSSGRLLYTPYFGVKGTHAELEYEAVSSYGTWREHRRQIEGHGHYPEMGFTFVPYSDDEGKSWRVSDSHFAYALMGWFDEEGYPNGYGNVTAFEEVTAAETNDGRVLLFGRCTVGRILYSYSTDDGLGWSAVLPTELANSNSPARLRRIPKTGDLMCVWNQVSREEIRRGYRRGRLSVAISKDSGASWGHFKTLELSQGLEDVDRIPPEVPLKMVRGRDNVGQLPEYWSFFHYANICFAKDKVYLIYPRGGPHLGIAEQNLNKQEYVLRICPLEWFYE